MIDYKHLLNDAQYQAVTMGDGPALIVAGAGSGKTRTIVFRLAWLIEHGIPPSAILLLTFTRKAAGQMQERAAQLLQNEVSGISGGTFHSFAYGVLRRYGPLWLERRSFTVMDTGDALAALKQCRDDLKIGHGDRSFPKNQAVLGLLSKSRNKEKSLEKLVEQESPHLLGYMADLQKLADSYQAFKRDKAMLDYDDLLFELEALLLQNMPVANALRAQYRHILVDEYQDTNLVQARLVRLLAERPSGSKWGVMAVGDEAQSIYSFRGATVNNILEFPDLFPGTEVVKLEENYRSTAAVLGVANAVLTHAAQGFRKQLFTRRKGGGPVRLVRCMSDVSQAALVTRRISELLEVYPANEIAVLFRAGFESFNLEMILNQERIRFCKYGGLKYTEAAHVKDLLAFLKLLVNPLDYTSFGRLAALHKGIGPKTSEKIYQAVCAGLKEDAPFRKRYEEFFADLAFIDALRNKTQSIPETIGQVIDHYDPVLQQLYPENYPARRQALEEIQGMGGNYTELDLFLADLMLEAPEQEKEASDHVVLSTVHSAKGLEWKAVLLIDLVEERFPSRHALHNEESFEEERRLMYVACTRAKDVLELYAPATVFDRARGGSMPVAMSTFLREFDTGLVEEISEGFDGRLSPAHVLSRQSKPSGYACVAAGAGGHLPEGFGSESDDMPGWGKPGRLGRTRASMLSGLKDIGEESQIPDKSRQEAADSTEVRDCRQPVEGEADCVRADTALERIRAGQSRYCRHRLFGRGRILGLSEPDKVRVDFPGYGVKTIIASYLLVERS